MEDKISLPAQPENQAKVLEQVLKNLDSLVIQGSQAEVLTSAYKGVSFVIQSIQILGRAAKNDLTLLKSEEAAG